MERYEHHSDITQNKLCPFKLRHVPCVEDIFNWHKNIEIILITEGVGYIHHGTDEIPLKKGDITLISPNVMHRLYSSGKFEFYYFIVDDRFWTENGIDITEYSLEPKVHDDELNALYLAMAEKYEKKNNIGDAISVPLLRAAVLNFLCYVLVHYAKPVKIKEAVSASEEFIKMAITYLGEHYTEDVTLEGIAAFCGVSKYHLAREFKDHTGQTVFEYVNMLRCKRASLLLSEGKSVTETAYACGYESLSYFSRVYRKRMGVSPSNIKGE